MSCQQRLENVDCICWRGCPEYNIKWWWNYSSWAKRYVDYQLLPLLPWSLWAKVVVPIRVTSMCQIDLFENHSYSKVLLDTIKPCKTPTLIRWKLLWETIWLLTGILQTTELCANYLHLMEILDVIKLCGKTVKKHLHKALIEISNDLASLTSRHNITKDELTCR